MQNLLSYNFLVLVEKFKAFRLGDDFTIYNDNGKVVGTIQAKPVQKLNGFPKFIRFVLLSNLPFSFQYLYNEILDNKEQKLFTISKECHFFRGCQFFVRNSQDELLGFIKWKFKLIDVDRTFQVFNSNNQLIAIITFLKDFYVWGEERTFIAKNLQGVEIGRIVQKTHDIAWELLKIEDKYQVIFNKNVTDEVVRSLIFSSLLVFALTSKRLDRYNFDTLS